MSETDRPATATTERREGAAAANKKAMLASQVKECLKSEHNELDDAVTTRSRLRDKRRQEVAALYYEKALPKKELRDPARGVVNNCFHQEVTVEGYKHQPVRPLVDSVMRGEYYLSLKGTRDPGVAENERPRIKPVGAFPQDDAHDYWGRASSSACARSPS